MIGIYYRYIHTPAGTKERLLTEKKSVTHTHTHTPHQFGMRGRKCRVFRLFIYTYLPVYLFIKCATRTRAHMCGYVLCV